MANNGATLVVVNETNGLFRSSKRWIMGAVKAGLRDLDMKDIAVGPVTVLWGESLAHDPDVDLDALEVKLTREADVAFIAAPSHWANGRGVVEVLGEKTARAAFVDDADAVVAVGALTSSFAPAKARGVWCAHGLPDELTASDIPAWVDVVLPLAHPYEQSGSFTSLEGRVQAFAAAGIPPIAQGLAASEGASADWSALARLSGELGQPLAADLRVLREQLGAKVPLLTKVPRLPPRRLTVV